jgi:hypothetical protein
MKWVCLTSNGYHRILPGFAHLFNKWVSDTQEITVAGYDAPPPALPRNFRFMSLGKQSDYTWSSGLARLCSLLTDQHILLTLDDYWIDRPVDIGLIYRLETYMRNNPEIVKMDLTNDRLKLEHTAWADPDAPTPLILSGTETLFQASTQAAIWDRRFLWRFLNEKESAWEYEKRGTKRIIEARKRGTFDGLILGCQSPPMWYVNAVGGEGSMPGVFALKRFPQWMLSEMRSLGFME